MAINKLSSVDISSERNKKQVKYLNKNYSDYKNNLVEFIKFYYPDDYQDFSDASPGSIFIDMVSYVSDVLSYYTDHSFKEGLLAFAEERENLISISQGFGFRPRVTTPSVCTSTISMLAPADTDGSLDGTFLLKIGAGSSFTSNTQGNVNFISDNIVDFANPTDREVIPFSIDDDTGLPVSYLVSKKVKLISAREKIFEYEVGSPEKYLQIELPDEDIIDIKSITDSEGNVWNRVDNLAQDYIFSDVLVNTGEVGFPIYSIKPVKVNRRFVVRINRDLKTELMFGSGVGDLEDVYENPDYKSVYDSNYLQNMTNVPLDTLNFTTSNSFGLAPGNTKLTITYRVGGGTKSNVAAGTINAITNLNILNETRTLSTSEFNTLEVVKDSVSIINDEPATGGADAPSVEQLRQSAMGYINAQSRIVTTSDYEKRVLSMPSKYGAVAKSFVVKDDDINRIVDFTRKSSNSQNTLDTDDDVLYVDDSPINTNINLYILGYDEDRRLQTLNSTVKGNVKTFLSGYRMLTDRVNIMDAYIVNFGIDYTVVVYQGFNSYDVITRISDRLVSFFDTDNFQINQPIIISDVYLEIAKIDGVQSITSLEFFNKNLQVHGSDYAAWAYNFKQNTRDGIIYPSIDPCIFELRYPQDDILGTAVQ